MPPTMNRRNSLAISALLNNESIEPRTLFANAATRRSASLSPTTTTTNSNLTSGTATPTSAVSTASTSTITSSHLTRHKRKRTTPAQFTRLMEIFDQTDTPSSEIRKNLAEELHMDEREVQVWFQNRRAKVNRTRKNSGGSAAAGGGGRKISLTAATPASSRRQRQSSVIHPPPPPPLMSTVNSYHGHTHYAAPLPPPFLRRASALPVMESSTMHSPLPPPISTNVSQPHQQPSSYSPSTSTPVTPTHSSTTNIPPITTINTINHTSYEHSASRNTNNEPSFRENHPSAIDLLASAAEYVGR